MIYLDHHATTPLDPDALAAILPLLTDHFANAGSITHEAGRAVAEITDRALSELSFMLGATSDEVIVTSGATESNNLALFGVCFHPRQKRRKVISLVSEHKATLDPLKRLQQMGFEVVLLPVANNQHATPGLVDLDLLRSTIDDNTALVSIMLANNEIGTIQPLREIADLCHERDCLLHTDATQAVGRMAIRVDELDVDLLSFSAHKFYGPKGVGGLFVRSRNRRVKLQGQIVGGGQQQNMRSGTLNSAGLIGMTAALRKCYQLNNWFEAPHELGAEQTRIAALRNRLYEQLHSALETLQLNGPQLNMSGRTLSWQSKPLLLSDRRSKPDVGNAQRGDEQRECVHVSRSAPKPRAGSDWIECRRIAQQSAFRNRSHEHRARNRSRGRNVDRSRSQIAQVAVAAQAQLR